MRDDSLVPAIIYNLVLFSIVGVTLCVSAYYHFAHGAWVTLLLTCTATYSKNNPAEGDG